MCTHHLIAEETEIQRQLADINRRYDALDAKIDERDDELDTALTLTEKAKPVDDLLETVTMMEQALVNAAPPTSRYGASDDLDTLEAALEQIQAVESEIQCTEAPVAHAALGADQLIQEKGKKLRPDQQQDLQNKNSDLKDKFGNLSSNVKSQKKNLMDAIDALRADKDQKVGIMNQHKSVLSY